MPEECPEPEPAEVARGAGGVIAGRYGVVVRGATGATPGVLLAEVEPMLVEGTVLVLPGMIAALDPGGTLAPAGEELEFTKRRDDGS